MPTLRKPRTTGLRFSLVTLPALHIPFILVTVGAEFKVFLGRVSEEPDIIRAVRVVAACTCKLSVQGLRVLSAPDRMSRPGKGTCCMGRLADSRMALQAEVGYRVSQLCNVGRIMSVVTDQAHACRYRRMLILPLKFPGAVTVETEPRGRGDEELLCIPLMGLMTRQAQPCCNGSVGKFILELRPDMALETEVGDIRHEHPP